MPSFTLSHPSRPDCGATYGMDVALGFFVEVVDSRGRMREYDELHEGYAGLEGALSFLVSHGFFTREALDDAKMLLYDHGSEAIRAEPELSPATVICNMKEWAPPEPPMLDGETATSSKYRVRIGEAGDGWRLQVFCRQDSGQGGYPMYDVGSLAAPLSTPRVVDMLCMLGFDGVEWQYRRNLRSDVDDPELEFFPADPAELVARGVTGIDPLPGWLERNEDIGDEASRLQQEDREAEEADASDEVPF